MLQAEELPKSHNGHSADELVSKLLMGFIERRIAPQTIADIARAQLVEEDLPVEHLSRATCNGILEIVTHAYALTDVIELVVRFAGHPEFPQFLSPKACTGALTVVLRELQASPITPDHLLFSNLVHLLSGLSKQAVACGSTLLDDVERLRVYHALKQSSKAIAYWSAYVPELAQVETVFGNLSKETKISVSADIPSFPPPQEVIENILSSAEHVLSQRHPREFYLSPLLDKDSWRLRNLRELWQAVSVADGRPYVQSYLVGWFLEGSLEAAVENEAAQALYRQALAEIVEAAQGRTYVLKGCLRALQSALEKIASENPASDLKSPILERATALAQSFLAEFVCIAENNSTELSCDWIPWALELAVADEDLRIVTRRSWQWVRTLGYNVWEEDLRSPPTWLVFAANRFTARIFQLAPSFWLQDYSYLFLFQLYRESLVDGFEATAAHLDYVEFLIRALRKRSTFFACRLELLVALKFLGRLKVSEEQHLSLTEARLKLNFSAGEKGTEQEYWARFFASPVEQAKLGKNEISRSLSLLIRAGRDGAKIPAYQRANTRSA